MTAYVRQLRKLRICEDWSQLINCTKIQEGNQRQYKRCQAVLQSKLEMKNQIWWKAEEIERGIYSRIRQHLSLNYSHKIVRIEKIVDNMVNVLVQDSKLQHIFKHLIRDYISKLCKQGRDQCLPHRLENQMITQKIHRLLERMIKKQYQKYKRHINYIELEEQETNSVCQLKNSKNNCVILNNQIVQLTPSPSPTLELERLMAEPLPQMREKSNRKIKLKPQLQMVLKQARQMQDQVLTPLYKLNFAQNRKYHASKPTKTTRREMCKTRKHRQKDVRRKHQLQSLKQQLKNTDRNGHPLFGDYVEKITCVCEEGTQKQQMAVIEWKERVDGCIPKHSNIELELFKYMKPDLLMQYLEKNKQAKQIL